MQVQSGDQAAKSSKVMELPAKLDGLELTNHIKDLFCDVAKREMTLHSVVTISGDSLLWRWRHHFKVLQNLINSPHLLLYSRSRHLALVHVVL